MWRWRVWRSRSPASRARPTCASTAASFPPGALSCAPSSRNAPPPARPPVPRAYGSSSGSSSATRWRSAKRRCSSCSTTSKRPRRGGRRHYRRASWRTTAARTVSFEAAMSGDWRRCRSEFERRTVVHHWIPRCRRGAPPLKGRPPHRGEAAGDARELDGEAPVARRDWRWARAADRRVCPRGRRSTRPGWTTWWRSRRRWPSLCSRASDGATRPSKLSAANMETCHASGCTFLRCRGGQADN